MSCKLPCFPSLFKKRLIGLAVILFGVMIIVDPPSPIRRHVKWKMIRTKKSSQMTSKAVKEIADRIVSNFHLSVVIFYNNSWISKPNLFHLLTTEFPGKATLIGNLYCPWATGCIACFHWATKAP